MRTLGQTAKLATGKIEAVVAGTILVVVIVLFAKYYERPTGSSSTNGVKPSATKGIE